MKRVQHSSAVGASAESARDDNVRAHLAILKRLGLYYRGCGPLGFTDENFAVEETLRRRREPGNDDLLLVPYEDLLMAEQTIDADNVVRVQNQCWNRDALVQWVRTFRDKSVPATNPKTRAPFTLRELVLELQVPVVAERIADDRYWKGYHAQVENGVRAFFDAAEDGDVDKLRAGLQMGYSVNMQTRERGRSPLMAASAHGRDAAVRFLLENGAKVNRKDADGQTALGAAFAGRHWSVARTLLDGGADPNAPFRTGTYPLIALVRRNNVDLMRLLLNKGADVNVADQNGDTALTHAVSNKQSEVAEMLLQAGANVNNANKNGTTPLMIAVDRQDRATFDVLMRFKADVTVANNDGLTALLIAVIKKQADMAKLLLEAGADVGVETNEGNTPLMLAVDNEDQATFDVLLQHGANVNAQDKQGLTALMAAAWWNKLHFVRALLSAGANASAVASPRHTTLGHASTALSAAALNNADDEVIDLLLRHDGDKPAESSVALIPLTETQREPIVRRLLQRGHVNVNVADLRFNRTALMTAAKNGFLSLARLLISNGARVDLKDFRNKTALDYAIENGHADMVRLLHDAQSRNEKR